ncbi:MAG: hypothetical protein CME70_10870 [Halobacteriovorax sp.]|nr:hypothetical protein [Halobacteriovorax sp.]|tara:strand:+ start:48033 stop:48584 length:552 start_codon:yes stop_codon:yes gene_type:complete
MSGFNHNNIKYEIASPCDQDWSDMTGDDKCRHCDLCDKKVFNLSSMTESEVSSLIQGSEDICVRLYKREDGTVLTEDCPVGLAAVRKYLKQKQFAAAALCFVAIIFSNFSFAGDKKRLMGKRVATTMELEMGEMEVQVEEKPTEIETVEPETDWDYEKKEKKSERIEHMVMGGLAPINSSDSQ